MDIISYLLSLIQSLYQQNRWLISFICRYVPLKQWALMILTPPNIRSLRLMHYPSLRTFVRNGLIRTLSLITKNATVIRSVLSAVAVNVTSPMTVPALGVMPQSPFYIGTTAPKDSFCVKSAVPVSPRLIAVFPL